MEKTARKQENYPGTFFVQATFARAGTVVLLVLIFGIVLILPAGMSQAQNAATVQRSNTALPPSQSLKTIIVADYYPYTYVNDKGVPDGFSVDVAKAVTRVMDLHLDIGVDTWEHATRALSGGTIDLLPMMAYSPERDKIYDFSVPHTIAYDAIFVKSGTQRIGSLEGLVNKTVIVMNKDAAHQYLLSSGMAAKMKLILVDSLPDALRTLAEGKGDAALMPKLVGLIIMKNINLTNLNPAPVVIDAYNRPFSFAVRHGNQMLLERLGQGLSIIKSTGQYQEIYKKWFGALEPPGLSWNTVIRYIASIAVVFLLIALGLIIWNASLRKRVASQTKHLTVEIEERKRSEEALQYSEKQYRLLVETANEGIWSMDGDHVTTYVNKAMANMLGYEPSEMLGKKVEEFFFPEDMSSHEKRMRIRHRGKDEVYERRFRRRDGNPLWTVVSAKAIMDGTGNFIGSFAMFSDITWRKRAEEELTRERDLLQSIMNGAGNAHLVYLDRDFDFVRVNEAYAATCGYHPEEMVGKNHFALYPNAENEAIFRHVRDTGQPFEIHDKPFEFPGQPERGTTYWDWTLVPVMDVDGQVTGLIFSLFETTERKRTEMALKEERQRLANIIRGTNSGTWEWNVQTGETIFNERWAEIIGYTLDDISPVSINTWIKFCHPEDLKVSGSLLEKHFRGEISYYECEARMRHKDGSWVWILDRGRVISWTEDGKPLMMMGTHQDITGNKQAEEELRKSEAKYREISEKINDILWTTDENFKLTYISPSVEKVLGFTPEFHMTRDLSRQLTPASISMIAETMERELALERECTADPNRTITLELEYYHQDGSTRWLEQVMGGIRDDQGKLIGIHGVGRDISERRLAEDKLRKSEKLFRTAMEATSDGVWDWDVLSGGGYFSPGYFRMLGYEPDAFPATADSWLSLIHPDDRERVLAVNNACIRNESPSINVEYRMRTHEGAWCWILGRGSAIQRDEAGQALHMIGTHMDITTRKKMEQALIESEARFTQLAIQSRTFTWEVDANGLYTYVSPIVENVLGYRPDYIIGKKNFYDLHPTEGRADFKVEALELFARKEQFLEYLNPVQTKDGRIIWVKTSGIPLIKPDGTLMGYRGSDTDITERKQAEEKRRELEERLQRAEKMEALGLLAGGVAHDLNNTLGILVGYAEFLHDDLDETDPRREDARNIVIGGEQAAAIVQDLLTLARRGVQTKMTANLNKIVTEFIKSPEYLKLTSFHPDVRIKTELEEELLQIKGSKVHLSKTLINLVSNAAEAIPMGGEIVIRTENRYLDMPVSGYDELQEGDYVLLTVSDEGEGITDDDMKRIFEPFYTKKIMGRSGTGLGLSVVWGTVKDHNGYIDVQSTKGKGTTFYLYFPVTQEIEEEKDAGISSEQYPGHGEKILVVDDVRTQRELAERILKKLNYNVTTVPGGEEAVEYIKSNDPDLIILDMIMDPGIDGFETYRQISGIKPGQKAIIVSGFAETERVKMAQSLGAGVFVKKPYIRERLGLAVRRELDRK